MKNVVYFVVGIGCMVLSLEAEERGYDSLSDTYFPDMISIVLRDKIGAPDAIIIQHGFRKFYLYKGQSKKIKVNVSPLDVGYFYIFSGQYSYKISYPKRPQGPVDPEFTLECIEANYLNDYYTGMRPMPGGFTINRSFVYQPQSIF